MKISLPAARKLFMAGQGLDGPRKIPKGKEGVAQTVESLGYVQIDTISVVERAHHHTLWSRCPDYEPEMLHELQAEDRRVFEYWGHAAAYLPMSDYRFYIPRMRSFADSGWTRHWLESNKKLVRQVRDRLRKEGPLGSSDFEAPSGKRGSWWDWKPAKQALEALFSIGEVMVTERRKFQRIYDLAERVLPSDVETEEPDSDELALFTVRRALSALGVASAGEIGWGRRVSVPLPAALRALTESGEVTAVELKGLDAEEHYVLTADLERVSKRRRGRKRVHLLSPFDNLTIRRNRLRALFDFSYSLECYHPAAKRRYGYFCLPILWGDQFIGRLDPKADRKQRTFLARKVMFEPSFKDYDAVLPTLSRKLQEFAAFNGCDQVVIEKTVPAKVRAALKRELENG